MKYSYTCKNQQGQEQNGIIEAPNEGGAAKLLQQQGLYVLSLRQEGASNAIAGSKGLNLSIFGSRVKLKDKIIFTQQLAMMTRSGLPLVEAFTALEEQTDNKYFGQVIHDIMADVKGGKTLSKSLAKYPKIYPNLYISVVAAGEKSGKLDEVLSRLSEELQKEYDLITKIKAALTYPIFVIVALFGVIFLMLIFVVPQLKTIFNDMGAELPLITRMVLGSSDILRAFWYLFLLAAIGIYAGIHFWAKTEAGGLIWDGLKIKIPVIGGLTKKIYIARFARVTGTLVASGLPILEIIRTVSGVINNRVYQKSFKKIYQEVESGKTFSIALKNQKIFPAMVYHLISVGEKSGKMDFILLEMADFFDKEVEATTSNFANLVEPILILFIGAGVGLVVASVIMPIYSLVNVI